jgi:hypothetical protein
MSRLAAVLALALTVFAAGCGDDEEPTTVIQTTTVTETSPGTATTPETTTEPETTTTDPEATTPEQRQECTDAAGNEIEILTGDVDCAAAKDTAAQYDLQGERVQEIGEFVCEGGNAQTRPVIFTCTGPGGEFVVSEVTGRGGP